MIKQLFLSLLLTSTTIHSMELTILPNTALHNLDILSHITHHICNVDISGIEIKNNIKSFARTNKTLYDYYAREKTQQSIVRQVALYKNLSDSMVARHFGYTTIENTIDYLFTKINSEIELTQKDLRDHWYLNSTIPCAHLDEGAQETLLLHAIKSHKFPAAKQLITAGIDCHSTRSVNPFSTFTNCYYNYGKCTLDVEKLFCDIIELLIKEKYHPDHRIKAINGTLLHIAASRKQKQLTRLLLKYGANPYIICYKEDAFAFERGKPKGWLTTMVNEINNNKQKS